ncbi:MAG: helix-turn-helix transcriptional regulator [Peptococcaceae bacterium]|nr:helix-turn-helix transcriptional regulator [Peptococcaceae bacterium]
MQRELAAQRRYRGITQKEMAKMLGITERNYLAKEHGVAQFKIDEMFAIAHKFNMDIGEIFLPNNIMEHDMRINEG